VLVYVPATTAPFSPGGLLMHGGYDDTTATRFGDTWQLAYSPGTLFTWVWSSLVAGGTLPRADHAVAHDAARERVVMFGGYGNGGPLADTLELVNIGFPGFLAWQPVPTNGSPGARYSHAMTWDARRQRTVLFGGADASGTFRGDTWEYDGVTATWTQVATTGPVARVNHELGYDPARGVVVLFSGRRAAAPQLLQDVWEWNGVQWRERTWTTTHPSPREGGTATWDPLEQRFLLFGGSPLDRAMWAYTADNDRFADGMDGGSTAVRCTQFPVAGRPTGFTFPSPTGFGWLVLEAAPTPTSLLFLDPPLMCGARGHVFGMQPLLADAPGTPARITFPLPAGLAGAGFTVQGLSLELAGGGACFRLTDPLAVTVAAP
jgi:hypothetical protein